MTQLKICSQEVISSNTHRHLARLQLKDLLKAAIFMQNMYNKTKYVPFRQFLDAL